AVGVGFAVGAGFACEHLRERSSLLQRGMALLWEQALPANIFASRARSYSCRTGLRPGTYATADLREQSSLLQCVGNADAVGAAGGDAVVALVAEAEVEGGAGGEGVVGAEGEEVVAVVADALLAV